VTLDALRSCIRRLLGQTKEFLVDKLMLAPPGDPSRQDDTAWPDFVPAIPDVEPEHARVRQGGRNAVDSIFVRERREGGALAHGFSSVLLRHRLYNSAERFDRFFRAGGGTEAGPVPREDALKTYCSHIEDFLGMLMTLIHLTSGQPARATELVSLTTRFSGQGGHRNIFYTHGTFVLAPTYNKTYLRTLKYKEIYRFLPVEVSELLFYYLWIVEPFYAFIASQLDPAFESSAFLCGDVHKAEQPPMPKHAQLEQWEETPDDDETDEEYEDAPITYSGGNSKGSRPTPPAGDGARPGTGARRPKLTADAFRVAFRRYTEEFAGVKGFGIGTYRHVIIAFTRALLPTEFASTARGALLEEQAGHSARTGWAVYGTGSTSSDWQYHSSYNDQLAMTLMQHLILDLPRGTVMKVAQTARH
jgi:hypothetical protein